jgi:hypothetical protein
MNVLSLARCLQELDEVKEFIARGVIPNKLLHTVIFAAYLSNLCGSQSSVRRGARTDNLDVDWAEAFLEVWEEHVYPVLKATDNISWAEEWRGGHITNGLV